jgi:hypothetical protein
VLRSLAEDGTALGSATRETDLATAVGARERQGDVRWVWPSAAAVYPALLRAGVRVARCHDVTLTERLLASSDGGSRDPAVLRLTAADRGHAGEARSA